MAIEVELPQLGESVTEGVVTAWLVEVGDTVRADQPVVEISTDKVDTEIPSPAAGTVTELRAAVDETVQVGQVLLVIGGDASDGEGAGDAAAGDDGDAAAGADEHAAAAEPAAPSGSREVPAEEGPSGGAGAADGRPNGEASAAHDPRSGGRVLTSPLVRRLLREAGRSPDEVEGTGPRGRITRADAEQARREASGAPGPASAPSQGRPAAAGAGSAPPPPTTTESQRPPGSPIQIDFAGERAVTRDLSRVRKVIARSMMESMRTTAQLTAAVEADLTAVMHLRAAKQAAFRAKEGIGLSPLPLIARAVCMVLPRHPVMNSSMDTDAGTVTYHRYINLGMAVDTERGLLVPNIKDAQDLSVSGLARQISDLAQRARSRKLQPADISGGTFTITNTGSVGTLFDTPILNPPEVAILATAAIEKRPVVVSDEQGDAIAIRWMSYLCLSYDHRMVDGADAARFLQDLKHVLETHDFATELGV